MPCQAPAETVPAHLRGGQGLPGKGEAARGATGAEPASLWDPRGDAGPGLGHWTQLGVLANMWRGHCPVPGLGMRAHTALCKGLLYRVIRKGPPGLLL